MYLIFTCLCPFIVHFIIYYYIGIKDLCFYLFLFNNCFVFVRVFLTLGFIKGIYCNAN